MGCASSSSTATGNREVDIGLIEATEHTEVDRTQAVSEPKADENVGNEAHLSTEHTEVDRMLAVSEPKADENVGNEAHLSTSCGGSPNKSIEIHEKHFSRRELEPIVKYSAQLQYLRGFDLQPPEHVELAFTESFKNQVWIQSSVFESESQQEAEDGHLAQNNSEKQKGQALQGAREQAKGESKQTFEKQATKVADIQAKGDPKEPKATPPLTTALTAAESTSTSIGRKAEDDPFSTHADGNSQADTTGEEPCNNGTGGFVPSSITESAGDDATEVNEQAAAEKEDEAAEEAAKEALALLHSWKTSARKFGQKHDSKETKFALQPEDVPSEDMHYTITSSLHGSMLETYLQVRMDRGVGRGLG
jgi:hypothetical protein